MERSDASESVIGWRARPSAQSQCKNLTKGACGDDRNKIQSNANRESESGSGEKSSIGWVNVSTVGYGLPVSLARAHNRTARQSRSRSNRLPLARSP